MLAIPNVLFWSTTRFDLMVCFTVASALFCVSRPFVNEVEIMCLRFLDTFRWSVDYSFNHDVRVNGNTDDFIRVDVHIALPGHLRKPRIPCLLDGAFWLHILLPHGSNI
jgi:hypothetical protein